jgi:hypothetical protein
MISAITARSRLARMAARLVRLYFLERACQAQVMACLQATNSNPPQGSPEVTAQQGQIGVTLGGQSAWPALAQSLDWT